MDSTRQVNLYYNAQNILYKISDPFGNVWQMAYTSVNSNNVLQSVTDPNSNVPAAFTYYTSGTYIGLVNTETQFTRRKLTYTYTNNTDGSEPSPSPTRTSPASALLPPATAPTPTTPAEC